MSKVTTKEKKSFSKKLFRRGSVRSVGSFMSRVLKTLSTLSHFGTEEHATDEEKDDGGFSSFTTGGRSSVKSDGDECQGFLFSGDRIPGVAGLKNHGNTCFMNAILQCLSNTDLFAEYLALEHYRGEEENDEQAKSNGVLFEKKTTLDRGEVTEQLGRLVRSLWTFEYTPQHSREFKSIVSKNALQYRGNAQHDAQEFLLWLLDCVHEDLNNFINPNGRPQIKPPLEEDAASEGPSLPVTSSFIQELFQAQYRSSLTCPHCQKQSNTFDPFLCISLPIPLPHTRPLYVTVVYQGKCSHCMRIGVAVPLSSKVSRLRDAVSMETKIPTDQIILTEMFYDGFHRSFCDDDDDLDSIQESDCIFAFETPEIFRPDKILSQRGLQSNLNQNNLKYCLEQNRTASYMHGAGKSLITSNKNTGNEKLIILVCNRACSGQQVRRFGHPFVLHLERTVTWDVLQKEILEKMRHLLRPGVFIQVGPFSLRVVGVVGITYLLPQEEQPLCHPTVERAYKSCGQGGPPHVKIIVEWDKETKDYLFGHTEDEYVPDSESVRQQREIHHQPQACTLTQCFQLYTKEEQLAPDDAWRCPHCKMLQQGSIKLSLWTLPDVLILHLKRFRQEGDRRVKMQNLIKFPLTGLDMTPHVVKRSQSSWSLPSHWSPWRRPYGLGRDPEDYVYDLYAVCNHHGTMHGGHYTAYCKNSIDGQWYCFDDSDVQPISDAEVCKPVAYILFYQRRTTIPSWSANSSVAGSTSSSLCEHWINRLPGSKPPSVASAASSRRTSLASLSESVEFTGDRSEDDGGFSTRPFVRSVQRQSLSSRSSVTSPLATNENGIKPSWSLSAKLQMRSNSPSRFSLDSFSSSTLERIGEATDDKVSTSCFGSYSKYEHKTSGKAPLAVMEGVMREENLNRSNTSLEDTFCKHSSQIEKRMSKMDSEDNNNRITSVDQSLSGRSLSTRESKHRSKPGPSNYKSDNGKRNPTKIVNEQDKSSKKRQISCSTQGSPASQASSSPSVKSSAKASGSKDKAESSKVGSLKPASSMSHSKKEHTQHQEGSHLSSGQQKQKHPSKLKSSSTLPVVTKTSSLGSTSSSGRNKMMEKSQSKESSLVSPHLEKPGGVSASKASSSARASVIKSSDSSRIERRPVRSSSSSSSVTSLRSPSVSSKTDLRRNSKSEDKGLSFFKSALRQKETRRSADFGKTSILSKKSTDGISKSTTKNGMDVSDGTCKTSQIISSELHSAKFSAKEKQAVKAGTLVTQSPVSSNKSKSSNLETSASLLSERKKQPEKSSTRKLSASMQSSAQSTQKAQ
ncbi:UBP31 hydrolase, partial [Polypterus senegalus]|nr:ubiquitin carboxyl-terminal hydrolase 31 isoform X1 [Polypterus senegalus]MBN3294546.1 UBP31 hydrolase [Polypterus senegalus]